MSVSSSRMSLDLGALPACLDVGRGVDYNRVLITGWYSEEKKKVGKTVYSSCNLESKALLQCVSNMAEI